MPTAATNGATGTAEAGTRWVAAGYDPDDIFGVRRALECLPERHHDQFFDRWIALTERCGFDVVRIHAEVRAELAAGAAGPAAFAGAWATVDDAMAGYLDWRAAR
ncbi:MAG TPA: hypothetical protein VFC99_01350 [Acidimicrobiia bacterium]|nr:hypothetical protein [Acidimicrobiia bacterium]